LSYLEHEANTINDRDQRHLSSSELTFADALGVVHQLISAVAIAAETPNRIRTLLIADIDFTLVNIWHRKTL